MKKGFLIIDGAMNAYVFDNEEFKELTDCKIDVSKVVRNFTLKQLDAVVRTYLKGGDINECQNQKA